MDFDLALLNNITVERTDITHPDGEPYRWVPTRYDVHVGFWDDFHEDWVKVPSQIFYFSGINDVTDQGTYLRRVGEWVKYSPVVAVDGEGVSENGQIITSIALTKVQYDNLSEPNPNIKYYIYDNHTIILSGVEYGQPATQSDWGENDTNKASYIKNKQLVQEQIDTLAQNVTEIGNDAVKGLYIGTAEQSKDVQNKVTVPIATPTVAGAVTISGDTGTSSNTSVNQVAYTELFNKVLSIYGLVLIGKSVDNFATPATGGNTVLPTTISDWNLRGWTAIVEKAAVFIQSDELNNNLLSIRYVVSFTDADPDADIVWSDPITQETAQVQTDWDEMDNTQPTYIKNKGAKVPIPTGVSDGQVLTVVDNQLVYKPFNATGGLTVGVSMQDMLAKTTTVTDDGGGLWYLLNGQSVRRTDHYTLYQRLVNNNIITSTTNANFTLPNYQGMNTTMLKTSGDTALALGYQGGSTTPLTSHTHVQNAHNHTQNPHSHAPAVSGEKFILARSDTTWSLYGGSGQGYQSIDYTGSTTAINNSVTAINQATGSNTNHANYPLYVAVGKYIYAEGNAGISVATPTGLSAAIQGSNTMLQWAFDGVLSTLQSSGGLFEIQGSPDTSFTAGTIIVDDSDNTEALVNSSLLYWRVRTRWASGTNAVYSAWSAVATRS